MINPIIQQITGTTNGTGKLFLSIKDKIPLK
jgi:hypothetical protein